MPRIRCYYVDCVFIDEGYCGDIVGRLQSNSTLMSAV